MARTLTLKALFETMPNPPKAKSTVMRWARDGKIPCDQTPAGPLFDLDEVLAARASGLQPSEARGPEASGPSDDLPPEAAELLQVLKSGQAPAIEMARAGLKLAGIQLARAYERNRITGADKDSFKRAIEELRRCEKEYLEIEETKGNLIAKDDVKAVVGEMARRLNASCDSLATDLPPQIELWMSDPVFLALESSERRRRMRTWIEDRARAVRILTAEGIEIALLEAARA